MNAFEFEIVTPDSSYTFDGLRLLDVPAEKGRMTVLGGHQPFVCSILPGIVRWQDEDGVEKRWQVAAGTLRINPQMSTLLTHHCTAVE